MSKLYHLLISVVTTTIVLLLLPAPFVRAEIVATSFDFPLRPWDPVTQGFGLNFWHPVPCGYHLAEDVSRDTEIPVRAAAAGTVRLAKLKNGGYGYVVIIEHKLPDGDPGGPFVTTIYGHLKQEGLILSITEGKPTEVVKGQIIGFLTSLTEHNSGSIHLHFGIRKGRYEDFDERADPATGNWFYAGYSAIQGACDRNDSLHSTIVSEWYGPGDFIAARADTQAVPLPIGPNFPISTATHSQHRPTIASDGTNLLVVWTDLRGNGVTGDIYGARVAHGGTVLDRDGFLVSNAADWQQNPAVSFDGTNYLVVWEDYRSGIGTADVYGARVDPNGQILDPTGFIISNAADHQLEPGVTCDTSICLVAWGDRRDGTGFPTQVFAARVDSDGQVLDLDGFAVSAPAFTQRSPALGYDGSNYLVVYNHNSDVYGTRVTPEATVLDPVGFPITTATNSQGGPAVAFDGANYLAVWNDNRNGSGIPPPNGYDIFGARVTPEGTVLDPGGIQISNSFSADPGIEPSLGFSNNRYLVTWGDVRSGVEWNIFGNFVTPAGQIEETEDLQISSSPVGTVLRTERMPVVGVTDNKFLVAWTDWRNDSGTSANADVYGQVIGQANGSVAPGVPGPNVGDIARIPMLSGSLSGIAVEAGGQTALVAEGRYGEGSGELSRVNLNTGEVSSIAHVSEFGVFDVAIESGGETAIVLMAAGGSEPNGGLKRVNLITSEVTTIVERGIDLGWALAIEPNGKTALVTGREGGLFRVNLETGMMTLVSSVGGLGLAIEQGGTTALVVTGAQGGGSFGSCDLARVDLITGTPNAVARIPCTSKPMAVAIEPGGTTALVANSSQLYRVDLNFGVVTFLSECPVCTRIVMEPTGNSVLVLSAVLSSLMRLDLTTLEQSTIAVSKSPIGGALGQQGTHVFTVSYAPPLGGKLSRISLNDGQIEQVALTIVPNGGVAVDENRQAAFITAGGFSASSILGIDLETGVVRNILSTSSALYGLTLEGNGETALVTTGDDTLLRVHLMTGDTRVVSDQLEGPLAVIEEEEEVSALVVERANSGTLARVNLQTGDVNLIATGLGAVVGRGNNIPGLALEHNGESALVTAGTVLPELLRVQLQNGEITTLLSPVCGPFFSFQQVWVEASDDTAILSHSGCGILRARIR